MAYGWRTAACAGVGEMSWLVLAGTWSPIVWRGGRRRRENFVSSDFLALDFDTPAYTLRDATRGFAGLAHLIGTTRSSGREKHGITCERFRVVVPWTTRVHSLEVYEHNMQLALTIYDAADRACKDGARPYFACRHVVELDEDGASWDVEAVPPRRPASFPLRQRSQRGFLTASTRALLDEPIPRGSVHNSMFKLGCALARAGLELDETLAMVARSATLRLVSERERERELRTVRDGHLRAVRDELLRKGSAPPRQG